jgi:RNA polymerase sigma-70 factor (ECF subfamily)
MLPDMLDSLDDHALMLRYGGDGDMAAFEALYSRYRGPLYRYVLRQCGDPDAAQDLYQEVWQRVIRSREDYRPTGKFSAWLFRVARNCLADRARRAQRRPGDTWWQPLDETPVAGNERNPEEAAAMRETAARLRVAIDELSPEQRDAFLLHQESGLTLEEIGRIAGVGRETIKSRLRYAVMRLRARLSEADEAMTGTHP